MDFMLAIPGNKNLICNYCDKVKAMLIQIGINKKENQELASLCDFLLPFLMNRQVGFKGGDE